jgi:hypothetical protein
MVPCGARWMYFSLGTSDANWTRFTSLGDRHIQVHQHALRRTS